jgi:hypothetical protein
MMWGAVAVVVLQWMLHDRSNEDGARTEVVLEVAGRRVKVGTVPAGCQADEGESEATPGKDARVSRLSCYNGGWGTYVDVVLTRGDRLTIRRWEQGEPMEGEPDPPVKKRRTLATVPVPSGARFSIKVKDQ